jgi:glycosyltransferase involved in cell wall biosynthesis
METKITFIIPTIGRSSLQQTIHSLLKQTNPNWKAIIIFDGVEPTIRNFYNKITILKHTKVGVANHAGAVRNYGISHATTEWVAFVDDDDGIKNTYVETFYQELKYKSDVILFRMLFNGEILPPVNATNFHKGKVGISFAVKKHLFDNGIMFEPSEFEDFVYLDKCRLLKYRILLSPYLLYFVRNYDNNSNIVSNRVFIKNK